MGRYTMKDADEYTIDANEWEAFDMKDGGDKSQEWHYYDYDAQFRVTLELDKVNGYVKLLGESFTYSGDSCYYYDVTDGKVHCSASKWHVCAYAPFALDEYGDPVQYLADIFRRDESGRVEVVGMIELPSEFVDTMEWYCEQDAEYNQLAYEFHEFAEAHCLDCSNYDNLEANVHTWLARVKGQQQYGFADVNPDTLDGVIHFVDECYPVYNRAHQCDRAA